MPILKIAIQKSGGRLAAVSSEFLKSVGFGFTTIPGRLMVKTWDEAAQVFFLRSADVLEKLEKGSIELGVVGLNLLAEKFSKGALPAPQVFGQRAHSQIKPVFPLGFGRCRLVFAAPVSSKITNLKNLKQKRIATSYPNLVRTFLRARGIKPGSIVVQRGSVEIAPESGEAEAIADLVESGRTLMTHSLREVGEIFESQAYLMANLKFANSARGKKILQGVRVRLAALKLAAEKKYVMLNCPQQKLAKIKKILPAAVSPTVLPLAKGGEFAVHSVAPEAEIWKMLPALQKAGARDILILNVEKLIQ